MLFKKLDSITDAVSEYSQIARTSDSYVAPRTFISDQNNRSAKLTLDEKIESLKRVREYGRKLAAEQGVVLTDDQVR